MLLALFLMAALLAAGIGASTIVLTEFRTTSSADESVKAYYAADSAMEQGLYTIFKNRLIGEGFSDTTTELKNTSGSLLAGTATFDLLSTTNTENEKVVPIRQGQTVQFNLFNQDTPFNSGSAAYTITISAPSLQSPSTNTGAWAEVQWVYILKTGQLGDFATNATVRLISNQKLIVADVPRINLFANTLIGNPDIPTLTQPGGISPRPSNLGDITGWIVRVKALYGSIPDLTLTACLDTDPACTTAYSIPGDLALVARGAWRNARTRLDAKVPWRPPSGGLLDFVLFSEQGLDKPGT